MSWNLGLESFHAGDRVIFRAFKRSNHPSLRARHVRPETSGEGYQYEVDKYWTVVEADGSSLKVVTRRGKLRTTSAHDPDLRKASWWERVLYADRFPDHLLTPTNVLGNPGPGSSAREGGSLPH